MNQKLRIISGSWRGRKIHFSDAPSLRPTADRVRETLFNWLQHKVVGSNCLDLYAGSGALAWEALSRGAASATLIEKSKLVVKDLRKSAEVLGCTSTVRIYQAEALRWLKGLAAPNARMHQSGFDLVFLDPPFNQNLLKPSIEILLASDVLADGAYIYLETNESEEQQMSLLEPFKDRLHLLKSKRLGSVSVQLLAKQAELCPD